MDYQQLDHIFSGEKMWYGKVQKVLDHIYDGEKRWFSAFANNYITFKADKKVVLEGLKRTRSH